MKDVDPAASGGASKKCRVGLVCFPELRREGMAAILSDELGNGRYDFLPLTVEAALRSPALDLVMLDAEDLGPPLPVLAAFRQARPHLRVLIVGPPADHATIAALVSAGAKGYLPLSAKPAEILMALAVVGDGSIWAPRKVLASLLDHALDTADEARREAEPEAIRFTAREREVLRLLVLGHPNREIATILQVDDGTIKAHLSRLMRKAGVENRTALTMRAIERHWT